MQAFSAAGQQFYQAQAAEQGTPDMGAEGADASAGADAGAGTAGAGGADEDVVEADYENVDEEK